jgi:hypothetical protein
MPPPPPPDQTSGRAPIEEAADQAQPTAAISTRSVASTGKELAVLVLVIGGAALLGIVGVAGLYATRERPALEYDGEGEPE